MKKHNVIKLLGTAVAGLMLLMSLWGCVSEAAPSPTSTNTAAPTPINTTEPVLITDVTPSREVLSPTFTPTLFTSIPYITPVPTANAELMLKGNVRPVLICSIGTDENQLGYSANQYGKRIPEHFYIDDSGWMAILDTYNKRIVIYDKADDGTFAYREEITVPSTGDTTQLKYVDGIFYLFHDRSNHIVTVAYEHGKDNSQNEVLWHLLPGKAYTLNPDEIRLVPLKYGGMYVYNVFDDTFKYVLKDGVFTESDGNVYFTFTCDYESILDGIEPFLASYTLDTPIGLWGMVTNHTHYTDRIIGYDSQYNTYFYRDSELSFDEDRFGPKGEMATDDGSDDSDYQSFIKIDKYGNFLGKVSIPRSDYHQARYHRTAVSVTLDGTIYCMMCFDDQVIVYEIT